MPLSPLLAPAEVAELFGVSASTVSQWARQGKIVPIVTPGGHRRFRRADVDALLGAGQPVEPTKAAS